MADEIRGLRLWTRATLLVVVIVAAVTTMSKVLTIREFRTLAIDRQLAAATSGADGLARSSALAAAVRDIPELERLAAAWCSDPIIRGVVIFDAAGSVMATAGDAIPVLAQVRPGDLATIEDGFDVVASAWIRFDDGGNDFGMFDGSDDPSEGPAAPAGRVVVWLDGTGPSQILSAQIDQAWYVGIGAVLVGALIAGAAVRRWTRRIDRLMEATERISEGDYAARVDIDGRDEIGRLTRSFDTMRVRLGERDQELRDLADSLQDRVEQRTAELSEALEAAQAAARSKDEFLANMSHELRTPLNAVLGFADMLRRDLAGDPAEREQWLARIRTSGRHLLSLIDDVLDLSKIESGRMDIERIECRPHEIVCDVASMLRPGAVDKGLSLDVIFDGPQPEMILGDPTRIRQVILNLTANAVKFTEQGTVTMHVQFRRGDRPTDDGVTGHWLIEVRDTGIGMEREQLDRIFRPFSQADSSTTRRFGGTGLGLTISRRLIEMMGGRLGVESVSGIGSRFTVELDPGSLTDVAWLDQLDELAIIGGRSDHESAPATAGDGDATAPISGRILVVDDGETNRDMVQLILERYGADVDLAVDGADAMAKVMRSSDEPYDLILMDMQMPILDGYDATRKLRAAGFTVPIVALTAHAMSGDRTKCLDAGCTSYLSKPVDPSDLLNEVRARLAGEPVPERPEKKARSGDALDLHGDFVEVPAEALADDPGASGAPVDTSDSSPAEPLECTWNVDRDPAFRAIALRFAARLEQELEALGASIDSGDFASSVVSAHHIKGSGGTAGYADCSDAARAVEKALRDHDLEGSRAAFAHLAALLPRIRAGLARFEDDDARDAA